MIMNEGDNIEFLHFIIKCVEVKSHSIHYNIYTLDDSYLVYGRVKWDGCSNWNFDKYYHGCTSQDLLDLGRVLEKCWQLTAENLNTWDE